MYQFKDDFAHSTDDLLDQSMAISQFLCDVFGESTSCLNLSNQAVYGLVVTLELQKCLIKTAIEDKSHNNELSAVGGAS